MKNNKKIFGVVAFSFVLGSTLLNTHVSHAAGGGKKSDASYNRSEIFQKERNAIERGDFQAWKTLRESDGSTKVLASVNMNNFMRYGEAFKREESGDYAGAYKILKELGLKGEGVSVIVRYGDKDL